MLSRSLFFSLVEAFTVFSQDKFQQRPVSSSSLTVLLEVFKVFLPDVNLVSVLRSRTLTLEFLAHAHLVDFKVFLPHRVPHKRTVAPNDDLPVPGSRPSRGFPTRQGSQRTVEQIIVFQCLARVMVKVFLVFTLNRVPQLVVELMPG